MARQRWIARLVTLQGVVRRRLYPPINKKKGFAMAKNRGAQRGGLLLALATLVLVGCADLRLYSPSLDEQGKKAQKAWAEVD